MNAMFPSGLLGARCESSGRKAFAPRTQLSTIGSYSTLYIKGLSKASRFRNIMKYTGI